jgi:hypothetical protein
MNDSVINKGFLGSPKEVFMAVFDSYQEAEVAAHHVTTLGVQESAVTILSPEDNDVLDKENQGGLRIIFRKALGLEELTAESAYATALEDGHFVLVIYIPESEQQHVKQVENLLIAQQAKNIRYFGNLVFSELAATTD